MFYAVFLLPVKAHITAKRECYFHGLLAKAVVNSGSSPVLKLSGHSAEEIFLSFLFTLFVYYTWTITMFLYRMNSINNKIIDQYK